MDAIASEESESEVGLRNDGEECEERAARGFEVPLLPSVEVVVIDGKDAQPGELL